MNNFEKTLVAMTAFMYSPHKKVIATNYTMTKKETIISRTINTVFFGGFIYGSTSLILKHLSPEVSYALVSSLKITACFALGYVVGKGLKKFIAYRKNKKNSVSRTTSYKQVSSSSYNKPQSSVDYSSPSHDLAMTLRNGSPLIDLNLKEKSINED